MLQNARKKKQNKQDEKTNGLHHGKLRWHYRRKNSNGPLLWHWRLVDCFITFRRSGGRRRNRHSCGERLEGGLLEEQSSCARSGDCAAVQQQTRRPNWLACSWRLLADP